MSTGFERRVKRLHDRIVAVQKKEPTVAEIKAQLDAKGIEYDKKATKAELLELLEKAEQKPEGDPE